THAWSGPMSSLAATPRAEILQRLRQFLPEASGAQHRAWTREVAILQSEALTVVRLQPSASDDGTVLEYILPREAGRRPDVVVLQNGRVIVVEFKETGELRRADIDQVSAYARDLRHYHSACEGQEVTPILVLCGDGVTSRTVDGVQVLPATELAHCLVVLGKTCVGARLELRTFLTGEYAPLPSLVAAARLLFQNLELPYIRRARSAGVHDAVARVIELAHSAKRDGTRKLVLVTGVPGAGKTLVGLQVAHSAALDEGWEFGTKRRRGAPATFLSGNGPLVQVLQDALKSRAFVQDMHRYIREHGLEHPERIPSERVIVFDEAQRAWDADKIEDFYKKKLPNTAIDLRRSEPDLLTAVAARLEGWGLVLALVGEGQEIHTGEEGGMVQWADAIERSGVEWQIHGPAAHGALFKRHGLAFEEEHHLQLDVTLRAHAAGHLHRWVSMVLDDGDLDHAAHLAAGLRREGFPIYVTRSLDAARQYVRDRFAGEPQRRYGLLASARARNLEPYGIDPGFQTTKRIKVERWFNDGLEGPEGGSHLQSVITEFQCQGLELDMPIICWGDDFWWESQSWATKSARRQKLVKDPHRLRTNAYRVLLTRGREGMVIFVPPEPVVAMDSTVQALTRAGAVFVRDAGHSAAARRAW
ncbi:MAG: hypothetical protein ACI841_002146, partial [Planctomycetota bacterium]